MGAGASSLNKNDLKDASVEEVAEAYKSLSDDARTKFDAAFAEIDKEEPAAEESAAKEEPAAEESAAKEEPAAEDASKEEPAADKEEPAAEEKPAEVEKETPAAEESADKEPVVEESAAPFLKKAFDTMATGMTAMVEAMIKGEEFDPEKNAESQKKMMEEAFGFFDQSFSFHDKDKTGTLDAEEAKVFFNNLVDESGAFFENIALGPMKAACDAMVNDMIKAFEGEDFDPELKASMIQSMKDGVQPQIDAVKAAVDKQVEDYKANKAERDIAAFKVMDKDGSGKLEKGEFLEAFSPGTEKNDCLLKALGITGPESPES